MDTNPENMLSEDFSSGLKLRDSLRLRRMTIGKMKKVDDWQFNGFLEARLGEWRNTTNFLGQHPMAETCVRLGVERAFDNITLNFNADVIYDNETPERQPDIEIDQGGFDLRIANVVFSPLSNIDIRIGRQILTWGTSDLIFINNLFPKDWHSFLIGHDNAYLKAPSDALKISLFSAAENLDIIYTPRFDSDRYINGERASYYNASLGRIAGTDALVITEKPDQWLKVDELSIRFYRNVSTYELAFYGYWKSPADVNINTGNSIFPRLSVYSTSFHGPLAGGIINGEWGYYNSLDDVAGNNPAINNGEFRALPGYEHELISNLILAMKLYSTRMLDHDSYLQKLLANIPAARQDRHEISARLTWMALSQKLISSLFFRYSPSDEDYYLRPKVKYSMDNYWSYELGTNIFYGNLLHTFLARLQIVTIFI